jgi:hypothetical protein
MVDKLFIPRKSYMELDELRNYLAIERWANRLKAGGRDWGTVLVAAADSHPGHNAHFTCDGINDDAEVRSAVNSLPNGKGQVVLLEGTYWFSSPVVLDSVVVAIRGMGPYASLIRTGTVAFDVIYATAWIANLGFRGVMGCEGWEGVGVRARDCSTTWVVDCGFSQLAVGIDTGSCVAVG